MLHSNSKYSWNKTTHFHMACISASVVLRKYEYMELVSNGSQIDESEKGDQLDLQLGKS